MGLLYQGQVCDPILATEMHPEIWKIWEFLFPDDKEMLDKFASIRIPGSKKERTPLPNLKTVFVGHDYSSTPSEIRGNLSKPLSENEILQLFEEMMGSLKSSQQISPQDFIYELKMGSEDERLVTYLESLRVSLTSNPVRCLRKGAALPMMMATPSGIIQNACTSL
ncbi:Protein diaphanous-like protein 3 [Sciurus carolinensis]|uniref:Protein diaphanous-like protein 3 n=1 Tax=Sciurus carolinensis TaxID=30640 RepID=A0AA41MQC0_SCICA|nr:Protein diaphanous-like protein 3 [Sciurus carolinensis]